MRQVVCNYCGNPAELVDSAQVYNGRSYGMMWVCWPCDARVGCHKNSRDFAPLGTLADAETRSWRGKAHAVFDPLWKGKHPIDRKDAYRKLQEIMGMTEKQAHISRFDVAACQKLISALGGIPE